MSLPAAFLRDTERLIPQDRRFTDPCRPWPFGTDASFYRLIPKLVVRVESEDEVVELLRLARRDRVLGDLPRRGHQPVRPGHQRFGADRARR
jgi:D-lactate dehydrogenase